MAVVAMPNYVPVKEAVKCLHISVKTARTMLKSGKAQGGEMIVVANSGPEIEKIKKKKICRAKSAFYVALYPYKNLA
ncbi:MAG: hypothetical protein HYR70_04565 [Chloroflexi bacterium]|nr:hypothetical protein [Chloroflexota bacterium]MBI3340829.1 hypothetical protein [Chloroflexota bacterium]